MDDTRREINTNQETKQNSKQQTVQQIKRVSTSPQHRPFVDDAHMYAEAVKKYRTGLGINQRELAEAIGVTPNAVTNWELGRTRPDLTTIRKLCLFFGISADDMLNLPPIRKTTPIIRVAGKSDYSARQEVLWHDILSLPEKEQRVLASIVATLKAEYAPSQPIIRTYTPDEFEAEWTEGFTYYSSACAGDGNEIPGDDEGESSYFRRSAIPADFDCVIPIDGDSMEPDYHSGDRVLVKRTESFNYGDIVVVFVNDVCMIKEYTKEGLRPLNDDKYRIIRITDGSSVRTFGKVVGVLDDGMLPNKDEQRSIDLYLEEHPIME